MDLVTALDVVEHLDDDVGGLQEMRRVSVRRPFAVFVPAFMFLWGVRTMSAITGEIHAGRFAPGSRSRRLSN